MMIIFIYKNREQKNLYQSQNSKQGQVFNRADLQFKWNYNYKIMKQSYFLLIELLLLIPIITIPEPEVPKTFGLLTVTHTRAGDNTQFMTYLKRYAYMDCPIINQISIVWNNQKSMEEMGIFADRANWKIPIYFYRTPYNAMYWRYNIPKQTKSEVFFSIDDDIIVDCQQLMKGFEVWRKNAIGNLAPIVTYGARFYQFTLDRGFEYGRKKQREYFNLGLNLAFVSRHFFQLYYADIWEINQLKEHILKKNNCDDIALNWITQYYYPQLPTILIEGKIQNRSPAVAQSTSANHYSYRNQCLKDFTDIFGINPLRYIRMKDMYPSRVRVLAPLIKQVVLSKQKYLNKYILKKETANESEKKDLIPVTIKQQPKSQETIVPKQPISQNSQNIADLEMVLKKKYEKKIQKLENDQQRLMNLLQQSRKIPQHQDKLIGQLQKSLEYSQNHNNTLITNNYWRAVIEFILVLTVIILMWKLCQKKNKKRNEAMFKVESTQIQKIDTQI